MVEPKLSSSIAATSSSGVLRIRASALISPDQAIASARVIQGTDVAVQL